MRFGSHPANLALRFLLELAALISAGIFGSALFEGVLSIISAILLPLSLAVIWGVFAVKDDPSRSGKTVVPVPGILRLILELVIFGMGVVSLFLTDHRILSMIFAALVVLHYFFSIDRIKWLLKSSQQ